MTGLERGDGTQRDRDALRETLRDYIGYVLTSARGLYGEPLSYGPMRMFDALEKSLVPKFDSW
ncbi:DUF6092 family protein [Alicyclobacillus macrosporangiidus]|uniref:Uncharacterized protein n=1 Tax=Alicyclobacillus macrosporangiidus TaxID=392015 RepID=A0A1I7LHV0_9BACL|nr:DUF6092 family protein [Alicyclobacillus macrosporangiidus]SFV09261.1 hypothetical protein SAMN05421543_1541 [Alicyclobacillus macrosporangiidus]